MTSTCAHYIGDSASKVEDFLPSAWRFVYSLVIRQGWSHDVETQTPAVRDLNDCGEVENR
jgi:hypothetical protein